MSQTVKDSLKFDVVNDSNGGDNLGGYRGVTLSLPADYKDSDQQQWRAGLFSVIIPTVPIRDGFVFPEQWIDGRFKGVKTIEYYCDDPSSKKYQSLDKQFNYHQSAKYWFRRPLRASMGDKGVDASPSRMYANLDTDEEPDQVKATAKRILFQPDLDVEGVPVAAPAKYKLNDYKKVDGEKVPNDYATVSLMCGEFVQFDGPEIHPLEKPGSVIRAEKEKDAFIILHVAVENCSNLALKSVVDSLNRERAAVYIEPCEESRDWSAEEQKIYRGLQRTDEKEGRRSVKISLLPFFFARVMSALLADHPDGLGVIDEDYLKNQSKDPGFPVKLRSSGYLDLPKGLRYPSQTRALTISTIIPAKWELHYPGYVLEKYDQEALAWKPEELWAWYMCNRYYQYDNILPDLNAPCSDEFKLDDFADWTMCTSEQGIAIVRKRPFGHRYNRIFSLSQTRFVDILLLVRRSALYMASLSNSLRNLRSGLLEILEEQSVDTGDDDASGAANTAVSNSILKFQKIQTDFMVFRDHLWFDYISGRPLETKLLKHLAHTTGNAGQFEDLSSEIELRQRVYESLSQSIRIQVDQKLAESERFRAEQEGRYSTMLSVVAAALAVPGFVALSTDAQNWRVLLFAIAVTIIFAFVFWIMQPEKWKRKPMSKKANLERN